MKKLLLALACVAVPASLCAEQWQILGTRPMGMGGAFVAVAQGPIAQYWNPAGLVKSSANVSGMEIPVGVNAEFTGDIIKNASQIGDMAASFQATNNAQTNGTAINAEQMAAFAKTLSLMNNMSGEGKGALIEVAGGANFKFSKVALSVNNFTAIGLNPVIDVTNIGLANVGGTSGISFPSVSATALTNTNGNYVTANATLKLALDGLGPNVFTLICGGTCQDSGSAAIDDTTKLATAISNYADANNISPEQIIAAAGDITEYAATAKVVIDAAAAGGSYTDNDSRLNIVGASFMEIAAGYAWNVDKWLHGLSLGANLKLINGKTANTSFRFLAESDTKDAFKMEDVKSSWQPAIDLGLLWNVNRTYPGAPFSPKVGLVMRNINSPSFDTTAAGDYDLDRQVRMGLAFNPARFWTLAMDMDLTKNKTPIKGFDSRELSLGTEINIFNRKAFNIPLRAGIISNLAEKSSKMAYTLGTGLNLLFMHFDVSGVVSSEQTELEGKKIPTKVGVAASFGLLF